MPTCGVPGRLALLVVLAALASSACTPRTRAPESNGAPPVFSERDGIGGQTCTRLLDDAIETFEGRLVMQLPIGVVLARETADRHAASDVVATCAGGRVISRVELREVPDDPNQPLARVREQLLDTLAPTRTRELELVAHDEQARRTRVVVHLRSKGARRSMMIELQGRGGRLHVARFECRSADFEALRPSFAAALDSLVSAAPQR
jgi:hypothetical protein